MLDIKRLKRGELSEVVTNGYRVIENREGAELDNVEGFNCNINNFDVYSFTLVNGFYVGGDEQFLPNGVSVVGLADGVSVGVSDNMIVDKPIQIINLLSHKEAVYVRSRIVVNVGRNSSVKIIQCSDSLKEQRAIESSNTEIDIAGGAKVEYYRSQNVTDDTALISDVHVAQQGDSTFTANLISLNGGFIKNNTYICFKGEGGEANVNGLYLTDKGQHIDNYVRVDHNVPNCRSSQNFRGILDDFATGAFTGYVCVARDAQMTEAYQRNNNLLLTDKAKFDSSPFLEIHADNVKCSHGATVGQLDDNAMFYLRSRGIGEESAKVLLMNAFAQEIVLMVSIPQFRNELSEMVNRRLKGELSPCEYCSCHCKQTDRNCI